MPDDGLRRENTDAARALNTTGWSVGTSGNVSARTHNGLLITPTGARYEDLQPSDIVAMGLDGTVRPGQLAPSSEWQFHVEIYRACSEVGAVVHCHSPAATALACTGRGIPAFHYMVAIAGGDSIRCAPYATFGTEALARNAVAALQGRRACLLANHGQIATGGNLTKALSLAQTVEDLATQYILALQIGEVQILDADEMDRVQNKFQTYGQAPGRDR